MPADDPLPRITELQKVEISPTDVIVVKLEGPLGVGPGGAQEIGHVIRQNLRLGPDNRVVVLGPGMTVEVYAHDSTPV